MTPEHPRLPGILDSTLEWMAATALKYGSQEGAAQVHALIPNDELLVRVDGINQMTLPFEDEEYTTSSTESS